MTKYIESPERDIKAETKISNLKIDKTFKIKGNQIISFMKLESISVAGKDANQSGVGKVFNNLFSLTVLLNLSIVIWFFMNDMGRFLIK